MNDIEAARRFGRIGGLTAHSRHSPDEMLAAARRGFRRRFETSVDPDGALPPDELARRTDRAIRAYMLQLAERSAKARKRAA